MCVCLFVKVLLPELKVAAARVEGDELSVRRAAVINISSTLGSVHNNTQGGLYPYRASKVGWLETLYCVIYTINASKKSLNYNITILLVLLMHQGND